MPNILDTIQLNSVDYDIKDKSATTVVSLTQSQYDDLPSSAKTDTTKLYNITDATPFDPSSLIAQVQVDEEVTSRALVDLDSRFGGLKLVKLTQSEYTNLQNKDANTLYVIV